MDKLPCDAIGWFVDNARSNTEVAVLSNVCRSWRKFVIVAVLRQALEEDKEKKADNQYCVGRTSSNRLSLSLMLLPSIIRCVVRSNEDGDKDTTASTAANQYPLQRETFCVAWFHPGGIQQISHRRQSVISTSSPSVGVEDDDMALLTTRLQNIVCAFEWQSYREPHEILMPFGFTKSFLDQLLDYTFQRILKPQKPHSEQTNSHDGNHDDGMHRYRKTTPSVRGAVYARPDEYCPCWDKSNEEQHTARDDGSTLRDRVYTQRLEFLPRVIHSRNTKTPSVEFVNTGGAEPVRFLTPPFACGPIHSPMIIMLIGIAMYNGCFLSGLQQQCEIGHIYPSPDRDTIEDMSAFCVATGRGRQLPHPMDREIGKDDRSQASCPFHSPPVIPYRHEDAQIAFLRGRRSPGNWHCYTIIFDGAQSQLRVDGNPEKLDADNWEESSPILDGLTIGGNHTFEMSLSIPDDSDSECDGAISELVVWKGRFEERDLQLMEKHLMQKHGIPQPNSRAEEDKADEWKRDVRALLTERSPFELVTEGIPLWKVTQDPLVAWERFNPVTGEEIPVRRIGARASSGSSDW